MVELKQSTAVTVIVGAFVDDTDGKTPETALTLSQADCLLSKNGGATAQKNDASSASHIAGGHYGVPFSTTDTGTLGTLRLIINEAGALPVWQDFSVVAAAYWDTKYGSGNMPANVKAISDDTTAADNLETATDGGSYNLGGGGIVAASVTGAVGSVTGAVGSVTGNVGGNVTGSVGSVVGAVGSVTGAVGSVTGNVGGNVVGSVASVTGAVGSVTAGVTVTTNNDKTGYALTVDYDAAKTAASQTSVNTVDDLVDDLETRLTATRVGYLDNLPNLDATVSSRLASALYTAPDNTTITAINAKTANLPADPASNTQVNTRLATSGYTAPDNAGVAAAKAVTDKLNTAMELDGAVYRFTTNALEQGPAGAGGTSDWTAGEREQIRQALGVDGDKSATSNGDIDTIKATAAKLDTAMEVDGLVYRFTTNALEQAPTGGAGSGAITWTYTLTSGVDATPIADADVWVTTDVGGTNTVAAGRTNAFGVVTFYLDAGNYFVWRQKSGWTFTNPDSEAVA